MFVVGGGNFVEQQSLANWAKSRNTDASGFGNFAVLYGSTDMVSAEEFCNELTAMGKDVPQGFM